MLVLVVTVIMDKLFAMEDELGVRGEVSATFSAIRA